MSEELGALSINTHTHLSVPHNNMRANTCIHTILLLTTSSSDMPKHCHLKRHRIIELPQEHTDGKNNSHSCAIRALIFLAGEQIGTDPLSQWLCLRTVLFGKVLFRGSYFSWGC